MNNTDTDVYLQLWNNEFRRKLLPSTVLLSIGLVTGFTGNLVVLVVYTFRMRHGKEDRYFIPYLALLDIFASTFGTILYMCDNLFWVAYPSTYLCKSLLFLSLSTSGASAHILLTIALYRFLKICRPHGKQMTLFWRRFSLILICIASALYALPLLSLAGTVEQTGVYNNKNITGRSCALGTGGYSLFKLIYFGLLVLMIIANIIATSALYLPIGCVIYRRFKYPPSKVPYSHATSGESRSDSGSGLQPTTATQITTTPTYIDLKKGSEKMETYDNVSERKFRTSRKVRTNFNSMFLILVLIYVFAYIPTSVFLFVSKLVDNFWYEQSTAMLNFYSILGRLFILNHVVNPFIYGYFDLRFRQEVQKLFCKCR